MGPTVIALFSPENRVSEDNLFDPESAHEVGGEFTFLSL